MARKPWISSTRCRKCCNVGGMLVTGEPPIDIFPVVPAAGGRSHDYR